MSLMSHPYKARNQNFDWRSDTSGTATSVATSENIGNLETKITVRILWTNKEIIKRKGCDHEKSASWEWAFERKS